MGRLGCMSDKDQGRWQEGYRGRGSFLLQRGVRQTKFEKNASIQNNFRMETE